MLKWIYDGKSIEFVNIIVLSTCVLWYDPIKDLNLPLPQIFLQRREVATKEKKEVACIVSKPLVSCLWGMWRVCKSSKTSRRFRGALSSRPQGVPDPTTQCSGFFTFVKSHPWSYLCAPQVRIRPVQKTSLPAVTTPVSTADGAVTETTIARTCPTNGNAVSDEHLDLLGGWSNILPRLSSLWHVIQSPWMRTWSALLMYTLQLPRTVRRGICVQLIFRSVFSSLNTNA